MSTRASVAFLQNGIVYARVYRHSDGYPEGLGRDLQVFFQDVQKQCKDTRFNDSEYLAARFIVWQASKNGYKRSNNLLDFTGVSPCFDKHGDEEYEYLVHCYSKEAPVVDCIKL